MPIFEYEALASDAPDAARSLDTGTIAADTARHARDLLRGRGLVIEAIRPAKRDRAAQGESASAGLWRPRALDLASFFRELSTLIRVGIPLLKALETAGREYRGRFHAVIQSVADQIASGRGLAASMAEHPAVFDELTRLIVEVGENSGTLDTCLERVAKFKERASQLRGRITNALIYPVVVLTMAAVISVLLMTLVVPNILEPLLDSGGKLPFVTAVVKGMSDFLIAWWWALLLGGALFTVLAALFLRTDSGRRAWHRALLRIPYLGDALRKEAFVHIASVMSTLMRSGVEFLPALQTASALTKNRILRSALVDTERAVNAGEDIAIGLERSGVFSPTVVQVFAIGQQSGQLEEMLERLSEDYDYQVYAAAQRFAALLEPIMILILAVIVGFIAFATILPILEAGNVL